MRFDLIAAVDSKWGIAREDKLPWRGTKEGRADMKWFKDITSGEDTAVVMGRKTWDTLAAPLPGRINVVIGRVDAPGIVAVESFDAAIRWCSAVKHCIVIGGNAVYRQALQSPMLRKALITHLSGDYDCDMFFPHQYLEGVPAKEWDWGRESYKLVEYDFTNRGEAQYLGLLRELVAAPSRPNRTGVPARGVFHRSIRVGLFEPGRGRVMPLLTTKTVNWPAVYHELIWFLRGSTTTEYLAENNVHIWDGNSSREFLDKRGLAHYRAGELGPIYGHQWRHWGAAHTQAGGIDQLAQVITALKEDPASRRMIVSAWNVAALPEMALPPCHYSYQFHVDFAGDTPTRLNCLVNMRSADVGLGVPFNMASYALLTHIVSHIVGLVPGELSISMADCHVYESHIDGIRQQIMRPSCRFPTLQFSDNITAAASLEDFAHMFTIDDYIIGGYAPLPYIKMPMAV